LRWRLPNSARNLAEAEFGKNGRISNLPKPKLGATLHIVLIIHYQPSSILQISRFYMFCCSTFYEILTKNKLAKEKLVI